MRPLAKGSRLANLGLLLTPDPRPCRSRAKTFLSSGRGRRGEARPGPDTSQSTPPTHSALQRQMCHKSVKTATRHLSSLSNRNFFLLSAVEHTGLPLASSGDRRTSVCLGVSVGVSWPGGLLQGVVLCTRVYVDLGCQALPPLEPPERSTYLLALLSTYLPC